MFLIRHFCWQLSGSVDLDQSRSASRLALHVVKSTVNASGRSIAAVDTSAQSANGHCPAQTRQPGRHRHGMIVAKLEEYLEANPNTPLYLAEICGAIGAAERTLRAACEEHLGMGPIRFLALRRMHLVRRALSDADSSTTVTRIATDYGFWELGRFSVAYRALFGETPSETLRRPAKQTAINLNRPSSLAGRQPFGSGELAH
jgi:AraC-like DNA-binding protein